MKDKRIIWTLSIPFRIMGTEKFFKEFQSTRESLERLTTIDGWAINHLPKFKKFKKRIKLISLNGRICYVPIGLKSDMDYIKKMDRDYLEKYPSDDPSRPYAIGVVRE